MTQDVLHLVLSQAIVCTLVTMFSLLLMYGGKYTPLVGMVWSGQMSELATSCKEGWITMNGFVLVYTVYITMC